MGEGNRARAPRPIAIEARFARGPRQVPPLEVVKPCGVLHQDRLLFSFARPRAERRELFAIVDGMQRFAAIARARNAGPGPRMRPVGAPQHAVKPRIDQGAGNLARLDGRAPLTPAACSARRPSREISGASTATPRDAWLAAFRVARASVRQRLSGPQGRGALPMCC